jgi:hypothetical protein
MALTYTIPSCCMSLLIAFIVPPPGVRVLKGGMANLPTVKPWNTPP